MFAAIVAGFVALLVVAAILVAVYVVLRGRKTENVSVKRDVRSIQSVGVSSSLPDSHRVPAGGVARGGTPAQPVANPGDNLKNRFTAMGDTETAACLTDILATPVSPELLLPEENGEIAQKTEGIVGPYELHDFFLYYFVRFGFPPRKILRMATLAFADAYTEAQIKSYLTLFVRRFFAQQFKRSCLPDGPKVGSLCLSPRGDFRMPSDAQAAAWLRELSE